MIFTKAYTKLLKMYVIIFQSIDNHSFKIIMILLIIEMKILQYVQSIRLIWIR